MPKIKLKTSLIGNNIKHHVETQGILTLNKIVYTDDDVKVLLTFSQNEAELKRSHDTYEILFPFQNEKQTIGYYKITNPIARMDAIIKTKEFKVENQKIHIVYDLSLAKESLGQYTYDLSYEVIE